MKFKTHIYEILLTLFCVLLLVIQLEVENRGAFGSSLYFYRNTLTNLTDPLSNTSSHSFLANLASGLLGNWITFQGNVLFGNSIAQPLLSFPFLLVSILLLQKTFSYWIPPNISSSLLALLLASPATFALHELFLDRGSIGSSGFLFMQFPVPVLTLFGIAILLRYFHSLSKEKAFNVLGFFLITFFLFLIHLLLALLALLFLSIHFLIRRKRKTLALKRTSVLIPITASLFVLFSISAIAFLKLPTFLGTITRPPTFEISLFNSVLYLFVPLLVTIIALIILKVSFREIFYNFYPLIIFFLLENLGVFISVITNQDWMTFLRFQGIAQTFHILYYVPLLNLCLSTYRMPRSSVLNSLKFEKIERFSYHVLKFTVFSICIPLSIFSIDSSIQSPKFEAICPRPETYISFYRNLDLEKLTKIEVDSQILKFGMNLFNKSQFESFMVNPLKKSTGSRRKNSRSICNNEGLGFLMLNGMNFSDVASDRARSLVDHYFKLDS